MEWNSKAIGVRWFNDACYEIRPPNGKVILVDPYIDSSPLKRLGSDALSRVDYVLISHTHFDHHYLYPGIIAMIFLGAFINTSSMFGVYTMVVLALLGILLKFFEIPSTPFILSYVLGSMIESNLRRGLSYSGWTAFRTRPVSLAFIIAAVVSILLPFVQPLLKRNKSK